MDYNMIYYLHVLMVSPLLMYSGYIGYKNVKDQSFLFGSLFLIGLIVALYHGYKLLSQTALFNKVIQNENFPLLILACLVGGFLFYKSRVKQ